MIVVDASAVLEVLLQKPGARDLEDRMLASGETLHAPHLLDVEIAQALRRHALAGVVSKDRGMAALAALSVLPVTRYPHGPLLEWAWMSRHNLTAYDAMYVALAALLEAPLLTLDAGMAAAAARHAKIRLI